MARQDQQHQSNQRQFTHRRQSCVILSRRRQYWCQFLYSARGRQHRYLCRRSPQRPQRHQHQQKSPVTDSRCWKITTGATKRLVMVMMAVMAPKVDLRPKKRPTSVPRVLVTISKIPAFWLQKKKKLLLNCILFYLFFAIYRLASRERIIHAFSLRPPTPAS